MIKYTVIFASFTLLLLTGCKNSMQHCEPAQPSISIDSIGKSLNWPEELKVTAFAGPQLVPSPACLAVAATGELYVGVDMIGSLGKKPGKGMIVKLSDCNNDGIADSHTEFAAVDNPRGLLP